MSEFNKLIQQFWIQILELNVNFSFLYKIRKTRQSDVKLLLVFLRVFWWQVANYCHSRFCLLSEKTLMPRPPPLALIRLDGMLTKVKSKIYVLHSLDLPSLFKGRQLILITSPAGEGRTLKKLRKKVEVWSRGGSS